MRRRSCGRSGEFFLVCLNRRSSPWISVMSKARARAFKRVSRVSRNAVLSMFSTLRALVSSRFFTSRGGGALLNATARFFSTLNLLGPAGHSLYVFLAAGATHSLLRSAGFSTAPDSCGVSIRAAIRPDRQLYARAAFIRDYLPHVDNTTWR